MVKVRKKVSGRFPTVAGAGAFRILRIVIETARKRGLDIPETSESAPVGSCGASASPESGGKRRHPGTGETWMSGSYRY